MNKKIDKFKNMTLGQQKEILLIVLEKSIDKSDGLKQLYNTIKLIDVDSKLEVIKEEFIKIYTFLIEAIDYIKSNLLKDSFIKLETVNKVLNEMRQKEKSERIEEHQEINLMLDKELNNI